MPAKLLKADTLNDRDGLGIAVSFWRLPPPAKCGIKLGDSFFKIGFQNIQAFELKPKLTRREIKDSVVALTDSSANVYASSEFTSA